jgi:putative tricarboxylic transport membrane protein
MTTVNRLDLVISILFALVGAYVLIGSMELKAMPGMAVGPGLFPAITGAGMLFFGLVMLAQTWVGRGADISEEQAVEEPTEDDGGPITLIDRLYNPLLLLAILALILLMPVLGFLITAMIFAVAMVLLGGGRWLQGVVFGAVMTGLTYALFVYGLRVPVPVGMWG